MQSHDTFSFCGWTPIQRNCHWSSKGTSNKFSPKRNISLENTIKARKRPPSFRNQPSLSLRSLNGVAVDGLLASFW
uniref:Uncharacterized protein n=1 Tax=Vitis vinifera TaxID=29760 RepID=F6H7L7_VITVI